MPERIKGLPRDISLDDPRLSYHVGSNELGRLELFRTSDVAGIRGELKRLADAQTEGSRVLEFLNFDVDGSVLTISLDGDPLNPEPQALYRNASSNTIEVFLKTVNEALSSGSFQLSPGAERHVPKHRGFTASVVESAPSILEVTVLE